jgi:hypothetical protein
MKFPQDQKLTMRLSRMPAMSLVETEDGIREIYVGICSRHPEPANAPIAVLRQLKTLRTVAEKLRRDYDPADGPYERQHYFPKPNFATGAMPKVQGGRKRRYNADGTRYDAGGADTGKAA